MDLLERFINYIVERSLFSKKDHLLLAVSGGLDSVVLAHICKKAGCIFSIAHCNFGLRGEESTRDERFVKNLAASLSVPFFLKHFDTKEYAAIKKLSIQVAARELRYQWFNEILKGKMDDREKNSDENEADVGQSDSVSLTINHSPNTHILTAHHLDDNIETVLMNLFKGTGIAGLHGILPKSGRLIRPLLFATREEIVAYAKANNLEWVEDSSNSESKYTRNLIRNELLPLVENVYPSVKENIGHSIQRFGEVEILYNQAIAFHKKKLLECKVNDVHIPVLKLQRTAPLSTIVYEIIKTYGFTSNQVPEVIKLLSSKSGRYINSLTHRILRNRAWLIISPITTITDTFIVIEENVDEQVFINGQLQIKSIPANAIAIENDPTIALLDKKEIQFPLLLRRWKEGDYFYPLGLPKKKKLARFFIDQKLSQIEKEKIWVLESNKRILWIVGHRIDNRFKIMSTTKEVLCIKWRKVIED